MKAAVYTRYGPPSVAEIRDLEKPVPIDDEVLIKVRAASVNPADWRLMRGVPFVFHLLFGVRKPTLMQPGRLGHDVAGQVEAIGSKVSRFKPGDEVFGAGRGSLAEYVCVSETRLALKPESVSFEQAASAPVAGLTALQGLRDKGEIRAGQKVLINGAAGGVGTFAVQIAKSFGAEVTGVCSTRNLEVVRSLGADHVIDYTQEDFTRSPQRYDLILDNVGNHSMFECRSILHPRGICVTVGAPKNPGVFLLRFLTAPLLSRFVSQKFVLFIARINKEDLAILSGLMESGKAKPVIGRRYPLSEAVEALQHLEEGHVRGKLIIAMGDS